jgi:sugar/nucleoside kinase (ribokinase family)
MAQQYDFIGIGDILVDAFIELSEKDARVDVDPATGKKRLSMAFGEKLPYKSVTVVNAVGNSSNASVAAHRLGLKSALVSSLGHDRYGKDCLDTLRKEGISTDYIRIHERKETNYHYVLRYGAERTILIKHQEFPYVLPDFGKPPRYLYVSSIGENGMAFHHEIAAYIKAHPETKLVFQPGTFQIRLGYEALKDLYAVTEIFFCNKGEAQEILKTTENDVVKLIRAFKELGPRTPVITDGPDGAYALDGSDVWFMPMYPDPKPPVDRTGAGDSFSATFTCARALGFNVKTALMLGPINSMSVVQEIGAQKGLLTRAKLEDYLRNAPAGYAPKRLA